MFVVVCLFFSLGMFLDFLVFLECLDFVHTVTCMVTCRTGLLAYSCTQSTKDELPCYHIITVNILVNATLPDT